MFISVISKCLKQATHDENFTCRFLKMTHFAVGELTFSEFQKQWTDFDNVCIILRRNQCYVLCCKNLKIAESIHVTHFGRLGHICDCSHKQGSEVDFTTCDISAQKESTQTEA